MGRVTSTVVEPGAAEAVPPVAGDGAAQAKPARQHLVAVKRSKELRELQARFAAYKRDGESGDLPKLSSEVLMDLATNSAA